MRLLYRIIIILVLFTGSLSAFSQSFDEFSEVVEAYNRSDYTNTLETFSPLAEQGFAPAQYNLGLMYAFGNRVPQNYTEAVKWFRRAAVQGNSAAQYNLGLMYDSGHGVPQNYSEAVKWYRQAAEQGFALAQHNLSIMYDNGYGVTRNPVMAYVLENLSAAQGYESALKNRDISLKKLSRDQVAEGQRFANEWRVGSPLPTFHDFSTWP